MGERAGRWQRRLATLIFADQSRMRVVRRRPPLTRSADLASSAGRIARSRIPPQDAPARSPVPPDHLGPALVHHAPDETRELARDGDGRDRRDLAAIGHLPVPRVQALLRAGRVRHQPRRRVSSSSGCMPIWATRRRRSPPVRSTPRMALPRRSKAARSVSCSSRTPRADLLARPPGPRRACSAPRRHTGAWVCSCTSSPRRAGRTTSA